MRREFDALTIAITKIDRRPSAGWLRHYRFEASPIALNLIEAIRRSGALGLSKKLAEIFRSARVLPAILK